MMKPKNVVIPAVVGFILSFLISLIASNGFFHSFLRGVLFGAAFAAIAAGVSFLYGRFLDDGSGSEGIAPSSSKNEKTGSVIDLTVSDEALTDDGQGPQFYVANNKHTLADEDIEKQGASDAETEKEEGGPSPSEKDDAISSLDSKEFQSIDLGQPFSAKEEAPSAENNGKAPSAAGGVQETSSLSGTSVEGEDIDELPDIADIDSDSSKEEKEDTEVIQDSDFAVAGQHKKNSNAEFPDGSNAKNHDAETMAKAIRTLLKKDE